MSNKIVETRTQDTNIEGYPVTVTEKFHTTHPHGRRTIRVEYKVNMPNKHGSWLAGTVTERVVEGHGSRFRTLIPEHRVA